MKTIRQEAAEWVSARITEMETQAVAHRAAIREGEILKTRHEWVPPEVYCGVTARDLVAIEANIQDALGLLAELSK